jgi:hypothetical protein
MGIGIFALLAAGVHAGCHELTDATGRVIESSCQRLGPFGLTVWLVMLMTIVLYVLPLITAGYLAVRLRWGRGPKVAIA